MNEDTNSTYNKLSRYVSGGITEVNPNALEWWEREVFTLNNDDTTYVVEKRFEGRLDLITALHYSEPRYWWVIAQYNNVLDPHAEIIEGVILYIPKLSKVQDLFSGKLGGVASTREVRTSILPIV